MAKRRSNSRKGKARRLARKRGIRVTEAHGLLLQEKNRSDPASSGAPAGESAAVGEEAHELRIHRTAADGTVDVLDGDAASHAVWWDSTGALTADHSADAEGEPTSAEYVQDPSVTVNDVTRQVIFDLRLVLHHAQDDPETVAAAYGPMEAQLRAARVRVAHERARGTGRQADVRDPDQDEPSTSGEIPVSLGVLLRRTDSGRGDGCWELPAVEFAAAALRRLVLQETDARVGARSVRSRRRTERRSQLPAPSGIVAMWSHMIVFAWASAVTSTSWTSVTCRGA